MRILLAHNSTYYPSQGGGDKSNRLLMAALAERGHEVRVVTRVENFGGEGHARHLTELTQRGVIPREIDSSAVHIELQGVDIHTLTRDPNIRAYFARQIAQFDPDIVICSTDDPAQLLLEAALDAPRARVVFLVRATIALPFGPDSSTQSSAKSARLRDVDLCVGVSEYVARYVREWGRMDAVHVPISLIEPGEHTALGRFDNPYVTMVNPCAVKGIAIFLALADALPHLQFAAVPSWGANHDDLANLRARPNITLLKAVDNIDEILRLTRIMLVPSLWAEARSRIVLEAMSRAVPVVASDAGGLAEAKLGVDYLLPVNQITHYNPTLDSRMVPVPQIPPQDIRPWLAALSHLVTDRNHYERLSAESRNAALSYIASLNVLPFENLLRNTKRRERTPIADRLSPEKRKLLALRLRQKAWFPNCQPRLFCFPYAGGGTLWCHGWNACPVLLPGRETRIAEKPFERMEDLIPALEDAIAPLLNRPFAFFGHSMGAGIAFELAHALARHGRPLPSALFVSSAKAPRLRVPLPEPTPAELLEQLRRLGSVPENDDEWMRLVFPVLIADARLYRNYHSHHDTPLNIPIFAYCGDADPNLSPEEMEPWRHETTGPFHLRTFRGGHFYFQTARAEFLESLARDQAEVTGPSTSKSS